MTPTAQDAQPPALRFFMRRTASLKLTPDSLANHLAQRLLPAYLVSGDEPLLAAEAADAIRARARAGGFSERDVHFIERAADWEDVRGAAANLSLFGSRRVLEIRLGSGKPGAGGNATLAALLKAHDPDTLLLVLTPRLEREAQSAEWVRTLEGTGGWVQVWPIDAPRLGAWLRGRAARAGLELEPQALEVLAARTEGNLLAAQQEIDKLALVHGPGRLSAEGVLAAVADSARFDVFQLGEAVLAGEAPRALRMLAGLRAEGTEPTLALWALVKAVRDTWAAGHGAAPGWGRQAAALEKAQARAPRLSFRRLIARAARADRMIKGRQGGDAWGEMALLASELCGTQALALPAR